MLIFIYFTQSARYIQHTASSWLVARRDKRPRPQDGQGYIPIYLYFLQSLYFIIPKHWDIKTIIIVSAIRETAL